jgi:ABC-2 type transport system ATP-binding protein
VDLEVKPGEIFGFLGPNGAGKTTTIRCLLDMIRPDSGAIKVLGLDPRKHSVEVRARTGYLPGELRLYESMTVGALLHFLNDLRKRKTAWQAVEELAGRLELDLRAPVRNLSKGNKQKVGLVQALMHGPELLILDEPTSGLDPLIQHEVWRLLSSAKEQGATVFFASHVLSEVQAEAERVAIIREGQVVEVAETASLVNRAVRRVRVRFSTQVDVSSLAALPGVKVLEQSRDRTLLLQVEGTMDALIKALSRYPVADLETEHPSLEDVFLTYYERGGATA